MQQQWEQLGSAKDTLEKRVREGLGRAEWELAIIERRRTRELGVEAEAGTDASPADAGEEDGADDAVVDVGLTVADTAAIEDPQDVGLLERLPRQYAAIQQPRRVLDKRSTNRAAIVASQTKAIRDGLFCDGKDRKRKRGDSDCFGE